MTDGTVAVAPAELRASAQAADAVAEELKPPMGRAVTQSSAAARAMDGWTVGSAIDDIARSWERALDGLHTRVRAGAANLRKSADGHEWNERLVTSDLEGMDDAAQPPVGPSSGSPFG